MKKLPVDVPELEMIFDTSFPETSYYLDLETGDIIVIMDEARLVELGFGNRYVDIPTADSHEGYRDMDDFVETVEDDRACELLRFALDGPRPFRRFKDALANYPDERQRWFDFKSARMRERVVDWLASLDIEPEDDPDHNASD